MCLKIFNEISGLFQCEERAAYFNAAYAKFSPKHFFEHKFSLSFFKGGGAENTSFEA